RLRGAGRVEALSEVGVVLGVIRHWQSVEGVDAEHLALLPELLREQGEEDGHAPHAHAGLEDVSRQLATALHEDAGVGPLPPGKGREHAHRAHALDQLPDRAGEPAGGKEIEREATCGHAGSTRTTRGARGYLRPKKRGPPLGGIPLKTCWLPAG